MITLQAAPRDERDAPRVSHGLVFDIETGPLTWNQVKRVIGDHDPSTVDLSKIPGGGEFDPHAVKTGNLKPENAIAKIEAARLAHAVDARLYKKRCEEAIKAAAEEHKIAAMSKAALSATTGRVLLSGLWSAEDSEYVLIHNDRSEAALLRETWKMLAAATCVIGFNIFGFDLPFIFQRSKILGVHVPAALYSLWHGRVNWDDRFVDLHEIWRAGTREWIKLGDLAVVLGVGEKNGDGADFADQWKNDRQAAMGYARNDLDITARIAARVLE